MAAAPFSPHPAAAVDPEALFRSAYDRRYTWDTDFPGYWVEVSVRYNQDIYHGLATVKPDFSVEVANMNSLTDADNAAVAELVKNELQMEAIHRQSIPFEHRHGQSRFELEGQDSSGAWQIRELGDTMSSRYKVQDQKIVQVNRTLGDLAVTVDSLGFERPRKAIWQRISRRPSGTLKRGKPWKWRMSATRTRKLVSITSSPIAQFAAWNRGRPIGIAVTIS